MAIEFLLQGKTVRVLPDPHATEREQREASNRLLDLAAEGSRFADNPLIRRGKAKFRALRRRDVIRELADHAELGLEQLEGPRVVRHAGGRVSAWLPDWECLDWIRMTFALCDAKGVRLHLPLRVNGELLLQLRARHIRCLKGWSQSYLEKHARDVPGLLKEPGKFGEDFVVDTIEFFLHFTHPLYPFMKRQHAPLNPFLGFRDQATRISA